MKLENTTDLVDTLNKEIKDLIFREKVGYKYVKIESSRDGEPFTFKTKLFIDRKNGHFHIAQKDGIHKKVYPGKLDSFDLDKLVEDIIRLEEESKVKIVKGTEYMCIKNFYMLNKETMKYGEKAYTMDHKYKSEKDGCITDNMGNVAHIMENESDFFKYFKEVVPKVIENPPCHLKEDTLPLKESGYDINHPSYYTQGGIECIDAMIAAYGEDAVMWYCLCNAFKYTFRCRHKDNILEDLGKAQWYINKFNELFKKQQQKIGK